MPRVCYRGNRGIDGRTGDAIGFVRQKIDGGVVDNVHIEHLSRVALNLDFTAMFGTVEQPNHEKHDQDKDDEGRYLVGTRTAMESRVG